MLELRDISVSYGEKTVLQHCDLNLMSGERIALMGPSGCGKTTLLRIALGLQTPDFGTVKCDFSRVSAVFQEPRLLPWRTALENVMLPIAGRTDSRDAAVSHLEKLELADAAGLYPDELSGGMQQRVSLARAMVFAPDLLVLDEAFKGLDVELRGRVLTLLAGSLQNTSVLLATHSEEEARALSCRILHWKDGRFE